MKVYRYYLFIIAISFLPFISIFTTVLAPHTHDSPVHYARMAAYFKALTEGQILPRWAGDLNYGYGMPLFNFIYHVPYLITSLSIALGVGLVTSFKISMALAFILSGIFMFLFANTFLKNKHRAVFATLLYQFAPFHLLNIVVRGDVAEGFALAFLPLVLYAILYGHPALIATFSMLLIISHNSMSLVFFGISVLFALLFSKNVKKSLVSLILGLGLSAFYWLPAIVERRYTYGDLFMKNMYESHFAPLLHFFVPNFTNSEKFQTGGIAVSFGLVHIIGLIVSILLLLKKRLQKTFDQKIILFCLILITGCLFLMQPISKILWESIPILRMFQFPWRLLNVVAFATAMMGAVALVRKNTRIWIVYMMSIVTVISSIVYFRPPLGMDIIDEAYYWDYPLNTTYFGETDVIWSAGPAGSFPPERFLVVGGEGTVSAAIKTGTRHTFTIDARSDVHVVDFTQYFPGWRVFSNNQKIPIEFQDQNWRGLITFRLPKGIHDVEVVWGHSPIRRIANFISLASIVIIAIYMISGKIKKYEKI